MQTIMPIDINFSKTTEPRLFTSDLASYVSDPQVVNFGAIMICRHGKACVRVNFDEWQLYEGAVLTLFPGDVVSLVQYCEFGVEMLQYDAVMLREASLQLEQTVYEQLREDRCRQDSPVVTDIINSMFRLLHVYFDQVGCVCIAQLVLLQLKAFFIGFHEYLQRTPSVHRQDNCSPRVRQLFNRFMMLVESEYKKSRDVNYYAALLNITPKYLTVIVRQITGQTPKRIIDHYTVLQLRLRLRNSELSIKQIAWEFNFSDVSFFCRFFKRHTGMSPMEMRENG